MNTNTHTIFLKEMGITQWTPRVSVGEAQASQTQSSNFEQTDLAGQAQEAVDSSAPLGVWWFIGERPQGDTELLMKSIVRSLGLGAQEWAWKDPNELLDSKQLPQLATPMVAIAFGGLAAQKLSGERDPLPQLRQTILGFDQEGFEELPLLATFELNHFLTRPKDKAMLWQDLLLAKSILQNI